MFKWEQTLKVQEHGEPTRVFRLVGEELPDGALKVILDGPSSKQTEILDRVEVEYLHRMFSAYLK